MILTPQFCVVDTNILNSHTQGRKVGYYVKGNDMDILSLWCGNITYNKGKTEGGYNLGKGVTRSVSFGWDAKSLCSWRDISDERMQKLFSSVNMVKRIHKTRNHSNVYFKCNFSSLDDIEKFSNLCDLDSPSQLLTGLDILKDRKGYYFEDKTFYRKRYKRLRFSKPFEDLIDNGISDKIKRYTPYIKCNCCGFESIEEKDFEWSVSRGLLNSGDKYISGCKNCGEKVFVNKLHDFTGDFCNGSSRGKFKPIWGLVGDPIFKLKINI